MHAEQFDFAGIRFCEAFADFDGSCFTCTVGTEQAEALASPNFEIEAVNGDDVLIRLAETGNTQGWFGCDREHESSIASETGDMQPSNRKRIARASWRSN